MNNFVDHVDPTKSLGSINNRKRTEKLSQEEFNIRLTKRYPHYTILGNYLNSRSPINIKCNLHNCTFKVTSAGELIKGKLKHKCPECKLDQRKSHFLEILSKNYPDISLKDKYSGYRTKLNMSCKLHPNVAIRYSPDEVVSNNVSSLCPICRKNIESKKKLNKFLDKLDDISDILLDFTGAYYYKSDAKSHSIIKDICCQKCGLLFSSQPYTLLNRIKAGGGCPSCSNKVSLGERLVSKWLSDNKIVFESQVKFDNSLIVGKKPHYGVIIDFVAHYNNIDYVIECNGEFHYVYCPHLCNGDITKFEQQLSRDKNVRTFFNSRNSTIFIEIPWTYYEIEKIKTVLDSIILNGESPTFINIPDIRYERKK